jgi:type I restriction enzyme S subunit
MPQNIGDNRIVENGIARVSPEDARRLGRYLVKPGDIVYSRRGDVERRALVTDHEAGWLCGTGCLRVRLGDAGPDPSFASYYLGHPSVREWIVRHAHGATMPNLNTAILSACPFLEPPINEQRAIAHILGTLDDKIELNRRMSETLEAMARALFKSWFVDFDPVRAKAEGRDTELPSNLADLFPDRLVESELGEIPEGWRVGAFSLGVEHSRVQVNPASTPEQRFLHFSLPAFDDGRWPKDELGSAIKSVKFRVSPGTVLLSKLNPEIERVWLPDIDASLDAICSTEFLVLKPASPYSPTFVYCLCRSPLFRGGIQALVTGTSKSHQRAQPQALLALPVVFPTAAATTAFEQCTEPLLRRSMVCQRESRTLARLRDTLLPQLISGELRVPDAERLLASAPV